MTLIKIHVSELHAGDKLISGRSVKSAQPVPCQRGVFITWDNGTYGMVPASVDVLVIAEA